MKQIILATIVALPCFAFSQYTYDKLYINFQQTDSDLKNFTYGNLRLYPIRAKEAFKKEFGSVGKYMPLKEALEKKKVRISETKGGGTVNNLVIENISNDTIIVITGEIVKGGKQDRIINNDLLLNPKSGKVNLPVYCVESGRWTSRNASSSGDFTTHYNEGSMELRKVVEKEKDQSKVWSKVDEINTKNKTLTSTGTYTALTSSSDFTKKLDSYLAFFKNKFSSENNVIGVIVVTGNKVLGCDMFATHELFQEQFDNLLHSYSTDAILNGKPVNISGSTVKGYMDKLLSDEKSQSATLKEKGNSFIQKGKKLRVSSFD